MDSIVKRGSPSLTLDPSSARISRIRQGIEERYLAPSASQHGVSRMDREEREQRTYLRDRRNQLHAYRGRPRK